MSKDANTKLFFCHNCEIYVSEFSPQHSGHLLKPELQISNTKCNCMKEIDVTVEYIKDPTRYNPKIDAYVLDVLEMLKERIICS